MKVKTGSESAMDLSPEFKHWYRKLKRPKNLRDAYILFRSIFHERNGEKPEGTTLLSSGETMAKPIYLDGYQARQRF